MGIFRIDFNKLALTSRLGEKSAKGNCISLD